ncbi:hypothetical protein MTO96_015178 [Rhipicephalus appendiculatus]
MKCGQAFAYVCLSLVLVIPSIVNGDEDDSCTRCICYGGKTMCKLGNGKCMCKEDRMKYKPGCASCHCARDNDFCSVDERGCVCRDGNLYAFGDQCAETVDELILAHFCVYFSYSSCMPCQCGNGRRSCPVAGSSCRCVNGRMVEPDRDVCAKDLKKCEFFQHSDRCATCRCPNGGRNCHLLGNKCQCVNGKYYMPGSDDCVQNEEDCILGNPESDECATCRCPNGGRNCHLLGNKCQCVNGNYYMAGSDDCVRNEEDCILGNPESECAKCRCPNGESDCHLLGNKCDCVNGVYYMPGSDECVQDKQDCMLVNPYSGRCAKCRCPYGESNCHLIGNKCRCINGEYYKPGSEECVQDAEECELVSPTSTCIPCQCGNGRHSCPVAGSSCRCVHGKMRQPDSNDCATDLTKCEFYYRESETGSGSCATCKCPHGQKKCHLIGNKCECVKGKYYMSGSDKCVQNEARLYAREPRETHEFVYTMPMWQW